MGLVTEKITYNVKHRGRKHLGQDRNLDTAALASLINSPGVQERVKLGDMLGYYGHWPRIRFGMDPAEGGVVDGVVVSVPAALKTIYLSADEDGNITHQAEFLSTTEGQIAEKLYQSRTGGFSSAIDVVPRTAPAIPTGFFGFDYVTAFGGPNYSTNRGHRAVMDGIASDDAEERSEMMALLDAAMHESTAAAAHINTLFDSLHAQHQLALETLERVQAENDLLVSRLAKAGAPVLDDIMGERGEVALLNAPPDFERYRSMPLAPLQVIKEAPTDDSAEAGFLRRQYGVKV